MLLVVHAEGRAAARRGREIACARSWILGVMISGTGPAIMVRVLKTRLGPMGLVQLLRKAEKLNWASKSALNLKSPAITTFIKSR